MLAKIEPGSKLYLAHVAPKRNPESNPEHLADKFGNPRLRAEALADLRWEMQMYALLDARGAAVEP